MPLQDALRFCDTLVTLCGVDPIIIGQALSRVSYEFAVYRGLQLAYWCRQVLTCLMQFTVAVMRIHFYWFVAKDLGLGNGERSD